MEGKLEMGIKKKCSNLDGLREPFAFVTITILSLLVPLSFLLLSRLSGESYISSFAVSEDQVVIGRLKSDGYTVSSTLVLFFDYVNPFLVQALVSIITVAALVHGLTGKSIISNGENSPWFGPRLYAAWIFLCTLQVCVGLGVEASIDAGISSYKISLGNETGLPSRVIFFLGLHETMCHWTKTIVKPVVDDTVFGIISQERVMQKVSIAVACGWLWWWRIRDEVESLVVVAEIKLKLGMDIGLADFVSWWLYYLVVTIGLVRLVRSFMWVSVALCCRSSLRINETSSDHIQIGEKV